MITTVISETVKYGRGAWLNLKNDKVVFDTSDGEYGPLEFDLQYLKDKIKQHEENLAH